MLREGARQQLIGLPSVLGVGERLSRRLKRDARIVFARIFEGRRRCVPGKTIVAVEILGNGTSG